MSGGQKFLYGLRARPADLNSAPMGFSLVAAGDLKNPNMRHGVISYERALAPQEVSRYELVELVDVTGRVLQAPLVPQAVLSIVQQAREFFVYVDEEHGCDVSMLEDGVKQAMCEQVEKIAIFERWAANHRIQAHQVILELGGLPERFYTCDEFGLHFKSAFEAGHKLSQRRVGG